MSYTREDKEAHERVMAALRDMTSEQLFQTLVDAGIYTADGRLTPEYGGDGED